ncbi:MAG: hypothetical protein LC808_00410, partial [Actinobacteria bacterium]|nr:hypothetical protein [Actinomycetota bacterium]
MLVTHFLTALLVPSLDVVEESGGAAGVLIYGLVVGLSGYLLLRTSILERFSDRVLLACAGLFLVAVTAIFVLGYPEANVHVLGAGSDRDDGLNQSAREILRLSYPYTERTYLGNEITSLPGAILVSTPFVVLGSSAYQNLFWLFVFVVVIWTFFDPRSVLPASLVLMTPGA